MNIVVVQKTFVFSQRKGGGPVLAHTLDAQYSAQSENGSRHNKSSQC